MPILQISDFYDVLRFNSYGFELSENIVSSVDGSGQLLTSHIGPRVWRGTINCSVVTREDVRALHTLLQTIQNPSVYFEVSDENSLYPLAYKAADDALLNSVVLRNPVAGYSAQIAGLPATYKLSAGDYFSLTRNGVNRIYKISVGATAVAGVATVQLLNPLPAGLANNTAIKLKKPSVTARLVPGSLQNYTIGLDRAEGASFSWVQTFRV